MGSLSFRRRLFIYLPGSENLTISILDVDDIDGSWVLLDVGDLSDSSDVVSSDGIDDISEVELGDVFDGVLLDVELQGITDVDIWVGESEGSGVVSDDVWVLFFGLFYFLFLNEV